MVLLGACSPRPAPAGSRAADRGWSDAPAASASAPAPRREERWDIAAALRPLRPVRARARSEHLGGDHEGEVLASDEPYPPRSPRRAMPSGATLVERLFEEGGATAVAYFVMVKRAPGYDASGGDWEYLVVASDGRVEERGALPLCSRCHAEAPHDHLFGGGR